MVGNNRSIILDSTSFSDNLKHGFTSFDVASSGLSFAFVDLKRKREKKKKKKKKIIAVKPVRFVTLLHTVIR